ncbi:LuxR family transcriptional regulator [Jeotgalibacillus sp. S-D1]|uniref:response regulator transcription factor n=1 Tax=Jeotgalibacillus sp. S-D1 TaxID=2552189 RepID=UPI00105AA993|nr:helix-turn-helix transcriptional regulator [Jeotgalibacillus sp. S-D1]TDL31982.1 LuxR family transcriptional regulator [Jeotgalibacillus sp. S-D1]
MAIKQLSNRERDVAVLVAKGKKDVEIARILFISRRRVGELIFNIKEKWEITSRVEIGIGVYYFGWLQFQDDQDAWTPPFYTTGHLQEVQI